MELRRGLRLFALAGLVGGLGLAVSVNSTVFGLEEDWGLPGLFALRGARPAPVEAVVVRFDRDTLARLRALPTDAASWPEPMRGCVLQHGEVPMFAGVTSMERVPRVVQACLVEELTRRQAAVIAFDIAFRPDPAREAGVPAFADAIRRHGAVILLERAVREWLPATRGQSTTTALQTEVLEGPHAALAQAAIATAPWLLPRGSEQVHQFWAFNPALPSPRPAAGAGTRGPGTPGARAARRFHRPAFGGGRHAGRGAGATHGLVSCPSRRPRRWNQRSRARQPDRRGRADPGGAAARLSRRQRLLPELLWPIGHHSVAVRSRPVDPRAGPSDIARRPERAGSVRRRGRS